MSIAVAIILFTLRVWGLETYTRKWRWRFNTLLLD